MLAHIFDSLRLDLLSALYDVDPYGIVRRLLLNDRPRDSPEDIFRFLGFVHLYTASGIHIYAFLDALDQVGSRLRMSGTGRTLFFQSVIRVVGCGLILFAWGLQQLRIGFMRPVFIFAVRRVAAHFGYRFRRLAPLFLLLGFELLLGSLNESDLGNRLSFGRLHYFLAVGGGLLGHIWAKERGWSALSVHAAMAVSSWLGTGVLDLFALGQIAYLTPLISLVTIPILAQATYPALLILSILSPELLRSLSVAMNASAGVCADLVSRLGGVIVVGPLVPVLSLFVVIVILGLLYGRKLFMAALVFVSIGILLRMIVPSIERSEVTLLPVGQGESILNIGGGRAELVDTGVAGGMKDRAWIDTLTRRGVNRIDAILFSHWDEDHVGALRQLVRLVPIDCIQVHPDAWEEERGRRWKIWFQEHLKTRVLTRDCIKTGVVQNWSQIQSATRKAGNNRMVSYRRRLSSNLQFVSFGDAPIQLEWALLKTLTADTQTIWKVNHHGSHTSTPPDLGTHLKIDAFWISAGRRNRYGHPHQSVVNRLIGFGAPIWRTTDPIAPHFYKWQWIGFRRSIDLGNEICVGLGLGCISRSDSPTGTPSGSS
jgi:competence protein ComEC